MTITIEGVRCFADPDDETRFIIIPERPEPQRDAFDRPALLLMSSGTGAILQLSTVWRVAAEQEPALRQALAARTDIDPALIKLAPPPIEAATAVLWLGDGEQVEREELARSTTATFPPHGALFNVMLDEAQMRAASAAIGGRPNFLTVRYDARVRGLGMVTASADIAAWFAEESGGEHLRVMQHTPETGEETDAQPVQPSAKLRLADNVDVERLPVVLIELMHDGDRIAALRPPQFKPVALPALSDEPTLRVSYATGGSYEHALQTPVDALDYTDLGLAPVAIDARPRRDAGAAKIRLHVRYLPDGEGVRDEHTFHFRHDTWQARWLLISRAPDLAGELHVDGRESRDSETHRFEHVFHSGEIVLTGAQEQS